MRHPSEILQAILMKGVDASKNERAGKTGYSQAVKIPEKHSGGKDSIVHSYGNGLQKAGGSPIESATNSSVRMDIHNRADSINRGMCNDVIIVSDKSNKSREINAEPKVKHPNCSSSTSYSKMASLTLRDIICNLNSVNLEHPDDGNPDDSVEETRSKLMRLSTGGFTSSSAKVLSQKSKSNPGTPPSPLNRDPHQRRKYSMGSLDHQGTTHRRMKMEKEALNLHEVPPPSRKRSAPDVLSMVTTPASSSLSSHADISVLRAPPRQRASTFTYADRLSSSDSSSVKGNLLKCIMSGGGSSEECLLKPSSKQYVALAKRILNPIKSRVLELIHAMVSFILDLPEFNVLSPEDQKTLLASSSHRLLLLFLAEANLEFAVTSVEGEEDVRTSVETLVDSDGQSTLPRRRLEMPTSQFVDGVQNFIAKCQGIGIRPSEYFFMRWIILFHVGANKLERGDDVANLNTAARQDLQEIITDSHPNDKLRYSRLLLALHTVFGVNCTMLESLFCAPLNLAGGLETFVYKLFCAYRQRDCAMTLASVEH